MAFYYNNTYNTVLLMVVFYLETQGTLASQLKEFSDKQRVLLNGIVRMYDDRQLYQHQMAPHTLQIHPPTATITPAVTFWKVVVATSLLPPVLTLQYTYNWPITSF